MMLLEYYGLKENPFNVTSDPDYLYLSQTHKKALRQLRYGINKRKGFIAFTGEVGSGKTTVCKALLGGLGDNTRTCLILNPDLPALQMLQAILLDFGITPMTKNKLGLVNQLNDFLLEELSFGNNAALILDEAQNMDTADLESIRLLSNLETKKEKLLQILLVGQPELRQKLNSPDLLQLKQRLMVHHHLEPLKKHEISGYIEHRLFVAGSKGKLCFQEDAVESIYVFSDGIPRLINLICERSLLAAFRKRENSIGTDIVDPCVEAIDRFSTICTGDDEPEGMTLCEACGKALEKEKWYYRNSSFYCDKKCFTWNREQKKAAELVSMHEHEGLTHR